MILRTMSMCYLPLSGISPDPSNLEDKGVNSSMQILDSAQRDVGPIRDGLRAQAINGNH